MRSTGKSKKRAELPDEEFELKNVKVKITMMVDGDILKAFKDASGGRGYQTLMNDKLREAIPGLNGAPLVERVGKVEATLEDIRKIILANRDGFRLGGKK